MMRSCLILLAAAGCAAPPPSLDPLIDQLTAADGERATHGRFHVIKPDVEQQLWDRVSTLPVHAGGDAKILRAIEEVYTRPHQNYYHGYIWHYPYLNSRKTIRLVDKLLAEYPNSPLVPRALWLKAFALRVNPPSESDETCPSMGDQPTWRPDLVMARQTLEALVRTGDPAYAEKARRLLETDLRPIDLPTGPLEPDPRD